MQKAVSNAFHFAIDFAFSLFSDIRYVPDNYLVRVSDDGKDIAMEALKSFWFTGKYKIHIRAGSMQPLSDEINQEQTLALVDRLRGSANIDQLALDKKVIAAFRETNPGELIKGGAAPDVILAIALENDFIMRGIDPGVSEGLDHNVHMQFQSLEKLSTTREFQALSPEIRNTVSQIIQQHNALHQQALSQEAGTLSTPRKAQEITPDLQTQVKSNAQTTAAAVTKGVTG